MKETGVHLKNGGSSKGGYKSLTNRGYLGEEKKVGFTKASSSGGRGGNWVTWTNGVVSFRGFPRGYSEQEVVSRED